jgi:hypothetical protein
MEDFEKYDERPEELFSTPVKAGKRTYFFDVKVTREGDYYLTITESKRKVDRGGKFSYEKHQIFLFREDFEKFLAGMHVTLDYIAANAPAAVEDDAERKEKISYSDVSFEELGKN